MTEVTKGKGKAEELKLFPSLTILVQQYKIQNQNAANCLLSEGIVSLLILLILLLFNISL